LYIVLNLTCQDERRFFYLLNKVLLKAGSYLKNMNYKNKISLIIFSLLVGSFLMAFNAQKASARCVDQYGGGQTCYEGELQVNKMVKNPESGNYTDNLYSNDVKYSPDQEIWFRVTIKNTGSDNLSNVEIKDKFPDYVLFDSGNGFWNATDKTLSWKIDNLSTNESKDYEIKGKIVGSGSLPNDAGTYCVNNYAEAKKDSKFASDTAYFCISKKVLGMTSMPKTGANLLLTISLLISISIISFISFRKFSRKSN
jgi:uncharacterized repeat protein (TIGR01451 family)